MTQQYILSLLDNLGMTGSKGFTVLSSNSERTVLMIDLVRMTFKTPELTQTLEALDTSDAFDDADSIIDALEMLD